MWGVRGNSVIAVQQHQVCVYIMEIWTGEILEEIRNKMVGELSILVISLPSICSS
jgi:hypothetical protein